jgi:glycosyltransferase involved in cell wall biosynthesis
MRVTRPIRILHVLGGMNRAGTETWLMHVLRNIDRDRYRMDFLVHTPGRGDYDDEIESLGSRVLLCASPSNPVAYAYDFLRILRQEGPYDAVHSHIHHSSGLVLRLAHSAGVRTRIAHSHSDTSSLDAKSSLYRRVYVWTGRRWINRHASSKIAASNRAAACLFGRDWLSDPSTSVLHCGLGFDRFAAPVDCGLVRRELGFAPDDFVMGHVGRFEPVKNHDLLLRILDEMLLRRPESRLLLIGEGPLERKIQERAQSLGIAERVQFTGPRSDVARLMLGAMDVFVMPSLYEGLGLAAVEAQAAGLPTILSDQIPAEVDIVPGLLRFASINDTPAQWASAILQHAGRTHVGQADALAFVNRSDFNIHRSLGELCRLYS